MPVPDSTLPHLIRLLFYFILINKRDTGKDEDEVPETDRKHYFHIVGNSQLYSSSHALQEHSRVPDTFASDKTLFPFGESGMSFTFTCSVMYFLPGIRHLVLFQIMLHSFEKALKRQPCGLCALVSPSIEQNPSCQTFKLISK